MEKIRITVYIKDERGPYASRFWSHIPRVGEIINLQGEKHGLYDIENIVWDGDKVPAVSLNVVRRNA